MEKLLEKIQKTRADAVEEYKETRKISCICKTRKDRPGEHFLSCPFYQEEIRQAVASARKLALEEVKKWAQEYGCPDVPDLENCETCRFRDDLRAYLSSQSKD